MDKLFTIILTVLISANCLQLTDNMALNQVLNQLSRGCILFIDSVVRMSNLNRCPPMNFEASYLLFLRCSVKRQCNISNNRYYKSEMLTTLSNKSILLILSPN